MEAEGKGRAGGKTLEGQQEAGGGTGCLQCSWQEAGGEKEGRRGSCKGEAGRWSSATRLLCQCAIYDNALVLRPARAQVADPQLHQLERQRQRRWRENHGAPYLKRLPHKNRAWRQPAINGI